MFSQTVEYALRAVMFLASRAPQPQTTAEVAEVTRVPRAYLSKVIQALARAGIVQSQRGLGGGVSLAEPASKLTILGVINAVEPIERIRTCPLGIAAHGVHLCPLHRRLDDALAHIEQAFAASTLEEMLAEPAKSVPLCPFPNVRPKRKGAKHPS